MSIQDNKPGKIRVHSAVRIIMRGILLAIVAHVCLLVYSCNLPENALDKQIEAENAAVVEVLKQQ